MEDKLSLSNKQVPSSIAKMSAEKYTPVIKSTLTSFYLFCCFYSEIESLEFSWEYIICLGTILPLKKDIFTCMNQSVWQ